MKHIPLAIPNLAGNELKYLTECVETNFVSSVGPFVNRFEDEFAKYLQVKKAVAVVNGTSALHIALQLVGVERGDEVLIPNLTFIAPLNALSYIGAKPILVDAEDKTFSMCPKALEAYLLEMTEVRNGETLNKKTGNRIKAIVPVHILGNAARVEAIVSIARKFNLKVVEDACESLGAKDREQFVGTIGDIGCFSFNGNKIITSGGGGMLITNNEEFAVKAKHLTTTAKTDPIEFDHDEVGYNYRMVNVLAAIGVAQLEQLEGFLEVKKSNALRYAKGLKDIKGLKFFLPENESESNYWFYNLIVEKDFPMDKDQLIKHLIANGVGVRPVWKLMEDLPMYKDSEKTSLGISRNLQSKIVCLPCSTNLTEEETDRVVSILREIK